MNEQACGRRVGARPSEAVGVGGSRPSPPPRPNFSSLKTQLKGHTSREKPALLCLPVPGLSSSEPRPKSVCLSGWGQGAHRDSGFPGAQCRSRDRVDPQQTHPRMNE